MCQQRVKGIKGRKYQREKANEMTDDMLLRKGRLWLGKGAGVIRNGERVEGSKMGGEEMRNNGKE